MFVTTIMMIITIIILIVVNVVFIYLFMICLKVLSQYYKAY